MAYRFLGCEKTGWLKLEEISQDLANYSHVYVTDISGFTVSTVNQLRKLCFSKDVKLKVVKNTLLKRAMEQSEKDYSVFRL